MKLDTSGHCCAVTQSHNMTFLRTGTDFQALGNGSDQQGVVSANRHGIGCAGEHTGFIMMNHPAFSMTGFTGLHDAAQFKGQALHAQAHAENRDVPQAAPDHLSGKGCLGRVPGSGGNQNQVRMKGQQVIFVGRVGAADHNTGTGALEQMADIVGEGIHIIDE